MHFFYTLLSILRWSLQKKKKHLSCITLNSKVVVVDIYSTKFVALVCILCPNLRYFDVLCGQGWDDVLTLWHKAVFCDNTDSFYANIVCLMAPIEISESAVLHCFHNQEANNDEHSQGSRGQHLFMYWFINNNVNIKLLLIHSFCI